MEAHYAKNIMLTDIDIKILSPPHYSEILLIKTLVVPQAEGELQDRRSEDIVMMPETGTRIIRIFILTDFTKRLVSYNICIEIRRSCFQY